MGSQGGTFYGAQILNGYVGDDGVFYPVYGYINYNGEYVSLEEDVIDWDEGLWGEEPEGWEGVDVDTESCLYQYAGSCYNQYEACMQILQDADYQEYQAYKQAQQSGGYSAAAVEYQQPLTLKDFLGCVEVDPSAYQSSSSSSYGYSSQQSYQYAQKNQYNCYGDDEACEKARQYNEAVYQYNQQQNQNRRYYVGPHCASDGHKIHLAVYKDEYCSVIDENTQVADLLGYTPSDHIDLFPNECMACMHDQGEEIWYEDEEVYFLEPMCSMLYQYSGKCNRNLSAKTYTYGGYNANNANNANNGNAAEMDAEGNAWNGGNQYNQYGNGDWAQMYQSQQQQRNEEAVCSFIDSVTSGTYGENGEIAVSSNIWSLQSWSNAGSISEQSRNMSPGMKAGLAITALATLIMAITACVLQGLIARKSNANNSWAPARRSKDMDPTDLARQNSGITMGRSRSGTGAAPLI
jgi:hypothetical protein